MENKPGLDKIILLCLAFAIILFSIAFAISSCSDKQAENVSPERSKVETSTASQNPAENAKQSPSETYEPFFKLYDLHSPGNLINSKLFLYHGHSTYILAEDNPLGQTFGDLANMGQSDDDVKTFIDEIRQLEKLGKLPKEVSIELRRSSPYGVKITSDQYLFFDEALDTNKKILDFNDPVFSFNHGKEKYYDYLLKNTDDSIATWRKSKKGKLKNYSKIQDNLKSIYSHKNLKTLSDSYPSYASEGKKLAAIIMDLIIWDQISAQVSTQIKAQTWSQVGDRVWTIVFAQVIDAVGIYVGDSIRNHIWAQIWVKIREQVKIRVSDRVLFKIWTEVRSQVENKVNQNLLHLKFDSAHRQGNLDEAVESAVDYALTVYQLGSVVIRHSPEVAQIQDDLARFIAVEMETDEIDAVLRGLKIPSMHEHYIIDNQLKILRSHLVDYLDDEGPPQKTSPQGRGDNTTVNPSKDAEGSPQKTSPKL